MANTNKSKPHSRTPLAKLTRPRLRDIFERPELLARLDAAAAEGPGIWIEGPPGAGKTTLVLAWLAERDGPCLWYQMDAGDRDPASFFHYLALAVQQAAPRHRAPMPRLTPEYLRGMPTFSRNFFRELVRRVPPPSVLVLDNVQEVGSGGPFFDILRESLEELPARTNVVVVSRIGPPETFARLRLNRQLALLDWHDLRLGEQESIGLAEFLAARVGSKAATRQHTAALHRQCDGWLAGLLLTLDAAAPMTTPESPKDAAASQRLFDYFAGEIFERRPDEIRGFLLRTALLPPSFDAAMAKQLTSEARADALLNDLVREHHFTQQSASAPPTYQYHPLFREFLQTRARATIDASELTALRRRAAEVAELAGARDEALSAFAESGEWAAVTRLICELAPSYAAEGRFAAIAMALAKVPPPLLEHEPWLSYWRGVCRQLADPREAAAAFETAYAKFRERNDAVGAYRTWIAAMHAAIYALSNLKSVDVWFERFVALRREHPQFPSVEIEQNVVATRFIALVLRAPNHADFRAALADAEQLFRDPEAPPGIRASLGFFLLTYYLWLGKFVPARSIVDWLAASGSSDRTPPIVRTFGKMAETWFAWLVGDGTACIAHMNAGLELARTTGVHIWEPLTIIHGVTGCLNRGDTALARQLLDTLERDLPRARDMDRLYYYHLKAWFALLNDDVVAAQSFQQQALEAAQRTGIVFGEAHAHFGMALVLHESHDSAAASRELGEARRLAAALGGGMPAVVCDLAEAEFALAAADEPGACAALRRAFRTAKQYGFTTFPSWRPRAMARLCALALAAGIEVEYVHALIRSRGLENPAGGAALDAWPFAVKIRALGEFTVLVNGHQLEFATKAQKKPLELLKALIALGGTQVREEKIVDLLWPDSEAAEQALKSAVHRLRKLIGEPALERGEGRLTLRRSQCWVDAFAIEQALEALETAHRRHDVRGVAAASTRVLALYRGDLLETEAESIWALAARERLRSRTLRQVEAAARFFEQAKVHDQALECYSKGLEIDPLAEPFYRGLIRVYDATGRRAEALHAYDRCRSVLAARLKVSPSAATEALVQALRSPSESHR